jgi:hypothetical protein
MSQTIINNNDTGLAVRTALNTMFGELYGTQVIPVKLLNRSGNFTQAVPANTWIERITVIPESGVPDIKIGTSLHGSEILDTTQIGNSLPVLVQNYNAGSETLYFESSGGNVSVRIEEINPFI